MNRRLALVAVAAGALAVIAVVSGYWTFPATPDGQVDWLLLRAGWDGVDPSLPVFDLASIYNLPGVYPSLTVARAPAFFVVQAPQLLSLDGGIAVVRLLNLAAAGVIGWVAGRMWQVKAWWVFALVALVVGFTSIKWATPELIWAAVLVVVWWRAVESDAVWPGVLLGVVIAVKLWPAILLIPLWTKARFRMLLSAIVAGGVVTLAGLFVPGVSVSSTLDSLRLGGGWATANLGSNYSLSTRLALIGIPVWVSILGGLAFVVYLSTRFPMRKAFGYAIVVGLLVSPIAWPHYWAAAVPLLGLMAPRRSTGSPQTSGSGSTPRRVSES